MTLPTWHSRDDFPHLLNSLGLTAIGVEVGVQTGKNLAHIRQNWNGKLAIGVDRWSVYGTDVTDAMHDDYARMSIAAMRQTGKDFHLWRASALDAAAQMASWGVKLDWVYLDGDHAFEPVDAEIKAFLPLIRSGGILAGHDWLEVDGWRRHGDPVTAYETSQGPDCGPGPFFVKKAVLNNFKREEISVTSPDQDMGWMSWAYQKP